MPGRTVSIETYILAALIKEWRETAADLPADHHGDLIRATVSACSDDLIKVMRGWATITEGT